MSLLRLPRNLKFPVFKIPTKVSRIVNRDGVIVAITPTGEAIIDDRNVEGDSLGERRLLLDNKLTLKEALYELKDILLTADKLGKYATYIDSNGIVFDYRKTDWAKVKYYPILKCTTAPTSEIQHILKLRGVHCPIVSKHAPLPNQGYVALLNYSCGYIFMGYADDGYKEYRIKI